MWGSGLRPARVEAHFRVLRCWSIEQGCRHAFEMTVEERQGVGVDDAMYSMGIERPEQTQSPAERCIDQEGNVGQVEMEHPWHLHEVAMSRQILEHGPHALMLHDITVRPTLEPPGVGIARDPHGRLLQARLHHIGRHRSLHHKAGAEAMLQVTGFGSDHATQRHAEDASALHIQMSGQDVGGIGLVQVGKLVQREDGILREVRDDAVLDSSWATGADGTALVVMYFKCVKGKLGTVREKPGNSRSAFCCANRASPGASALAS